MRAFGLLLLLAGCQPQQWQGTWSGSATLNDGRMPLTATGTMDVTNGAGIPASLIFAFRGKTGGTTEFACPAGGVQSAMATSSTATIVTGASCVMTATPADGCTRTVTFNSGELTIRGDAMTGSGQGRLDLACPSTGSAVSDFGFTVTATLMK